MLWIAGACAISVLVCALMCIAITLKQQLDQAHRENARILRIGKRFERELQERIANTQIIPASFDDTFGANQSPQLKGARRNALPVMYLRLHHPVGIVRQPITATVTLAAAN